MAKVSAVPVCDMLLRCVLGAFHRGCVLVSLSCNANAGQGDAKMLVHSAALLAAG